MGPASSTFTIKEFSIHWVKNQLSQGVLVTRNSLKNALKQHFDTCPWQYGTSKEGNTPNWDSVYGTFRSMFAAVKNNSGGDKGLVGSLFVISKEGIDFIFDTDNTFLKAQIGMSFREQQYGENIKVSDPHTESQFRLCQIGSAAGYKLFVPFSNRNKKTSNDMTIAQVFADDLVDDFEGMTKITKEIDVIFLDEQDGKLIPIRSYEVENSTNVISGVGRMLALKCVGVIVDTQNQYKEKFDMYIKESFSDKKDSLVYRKSSEIYKLSEAFGEYEDAFDKKEMQKMISNKC